MSQIVDVPGVGEVEFPDEMSDADVAAAARKLHQQNAMLPSHTPGGELPPPHPTSAGESLARGGLQGVSMGFGDEGAAAIAAALPFTDREAAKGETLGERYRNARDFYRNRNKAAQQDNPTTYFAGQMAGAVAPALLGGAPVSGTKALVSAAGQGAAQGAGYSDATSVGGLAGDTAVGAGLGVAGYGAGALVGKGFSKLASAGAARSGLAAASAGSKAAGEVAEGLQSAAGKYGGEMQKGSRYIENLMRLEEGMTPSQRAVYQQLQEQGIIPNLQQAVAQSTLDALPGQAATIAARKAELAAAQQGAPAAAAERTQQLLSGEELKRQVRERAWRYGPPAVASAVGGFVGGPLGTAVGYAAGAGSRPMVQSLRRLAKSPSAQKAIGDTMQRAGESALGQRLVRGLTYGVPAVVDSNLGN